MFYNVPPVTFTPTLLFITIRVHSMFYNVPLVTILSNTFHHCWRSFIICEVYSIVGEVLIVVDKVFIIG